VSLIVVLCALTLGACGGGSGGAPDSAGQTTTGKQEERAQQAPPTVPGGSLAIPGKVPLRSSGTGDPADITVIRLWTDALRRSDVNGASALWAVPSKVQNGTPVLTLASRSDVRLFNDSLSCGSRLVSALGAENGYTIAVFVLTNRPGGDCGTGVGNHARTAILVRSGKIVEWYRLPEDPDAPRPAPQQPAEPQEPEAPII